MLDRLFAWLNSFRKPSSPSIPEDARYVIVSHGPDRGQVLVVPPKSGVVIEPTQYTPGGSESRQAWLFKNGEDEEKRREAANRSWMVEYLPDECLFR